MKKYRGGITFGRHSSSSSSAGRFLLASLLVAILFLSGVLFFVSSVHRHHQRSSEEEDGGPQDSAERISVRDGQHDSSHPPIGIFHETAPDESPPERDHRFRAEMENNAAAHHTHMTGKDGDSPGVGGGGDIHEEREARMLNLLERLRSHRGDNANRDRGELGALRSLNIDEDIARSIDAQRKKFDEWMRRRHPHDDGPPGADSVSGDGDVHPGHAVKQVRRDVDQRMKEQRRILDDLRNTAFGLAGGGDHPTSLEKRGTGASLRIAIFTTFKSCSEPSIRYAQMDAVSSWVSLPTHPAPVVLLMGGDAECSRWVADAVNQAHDEALGPPSDGSKVVRVVEDAKTGASGNTVLLGPAMERLAQEVPNADLYGLINADILLDPLSSIALHRIAGHFSEYFVVGHRFAVNIPLERRASYRMFPQSGNVVAAADGEQAAATSDDSLNFFTPGWSYRGDPIFARASPDRVDAEDFFFWSRGFFDNATTDDRSSSKVSHPAKPSAVSIPSFHIGRPAYDNWLVHHAIHTWKPTIDASELLVAYHQTHGYHHLVEADASKLKKENGDQHMEAQQQQQDGQRKDKAATYWGGVEQRENYNLGLSTGGWQHGSMDMIPLAFEPSGCSENFRHHAMQQTQLHRRSAAGGRITPRESREAAGKLLFDWFAFTVTQERANAHRHHARSGRDCSLRLRTGWRPFADGSPFSSESEYSRQYESYHTELS